MTLEEIKIKIKSMGAGAGARWVTIATSAMAGSKEANAACADLLGRPVKNQLDLFNIMRAAFDCTTPGEYDMRQSQAQQALDAGHNTIRDADPYLNNRLAQLRKAAGMTQNQLAIAAHMPVTTLQKLENGTNSILRARTETTLALSRALGITVEQLVGGEGSK